MRSRKFQNGIQQCGSTCGDRWSAVTSMCIIARLRFVDRDRTAAERTAVQSHNGFFSIFHSRHVDKSKASGCSGVAVRHHADARDPPIAVKRIPKFGFGRLPGQVSYKNRRHSISLAHGGNRVSTCRASLRSTMPEPGNVECGPDARSTWNATLRAFNSRSADFAGPAGGKNVFLWPSAGNR